jgi:hypothetical protein
VALVVAANHFALAKQGEQFHYFLLSGFRDELTLVVLSLLELSFDELSLEGLSLAEPSDFGVSSFLDSLASLESLLPPSEEGA